MAVRADQERYSRASRASPRLRAAASAAAGQAAAWYRIGAVRARPPLPWSWTATTGCCGRALRPARSGWSRGTGSWSSELLALARQVRRDGEIREGEIEVPVPRLGGRTTSFAVRVAPLGAAVGGGGLVLVLAEDQTESRRVDEVRRDFVANISHELKTPVGALHLLAEAILEASDDPEAVRRFAGRMSHESSRLARIVQELIDLSRLQGADPLPRPSRSRWPRS